MQLKLTIKAPELFRSIIGKPLPAMERRGWTGNNREKEPAKINWFEGKNILYGRNFTGLQLLIC